MHKSLQLHLYCAIRCVLWCCLKFTGQFYNLTPHASLKCCNITTCSAVIAHMQHETQYSCDYNGKWPLINIGRACYAPPRSKPRSQSGRWDRHGDVSDGDWQGNQEVYVPHQPRELLGSGGPRRHPEYCHWSVSECKMNTSSIVCVSSTFSITDMGNKGNCVLG